MARSAATLIENNFVKGLITEATGLNYPENSCIETWDCEFDFFGRVARRLGQDLELNYTDKVIDKTASAINTYHWKNVLGDGSVSLIVTQVGNTLYFYSTENPASLSANVLASTINLSVYTPATAPEARLYDCQFTDGLGKLYVFHPYLENFYITYDANTDTVSGTQYTLKVRDFEGAIADPNAVDTRPTSTLAALNASHKYNLFNQGWAKADLTTPELTAWDTARTDMPSNADVWWDFKNASDAFDTTTIVNSARGNSPAPNGHFIMTAYNMDRSTISGIASLATTTSGTARTSTGAFHAGRVFYSGINSASYNGKIYFSQIVERDTQLGFCYQVNDPTSETLFDLLPADGGVISIPEAGTIYKLFSMANGLLVFGYRGVWFITGSTGIGFTATDYTVSKISSVRTISASSFVEVNGVPMWWNTDGIFTVQGAQGGPQVQSVSISSIQAFFNSIPNNAKIYAKGEFNPLAQTVQWLFASVAPSTTEEQHAFDAVLNFNVLTGAFYPWTINTTYAQVHGLVVVDGVGGATSEEIVVDEAAVTVVDSLGNIVVANLLTNTAVLPRTKFFTSHVVSGSTKFTWSEHRQETYLDWELLTPVDYISYFVTGYKLHGSAMTKFQPMYVNVYNEGIGAAYIQGIWDYAHETSTGRYSTAQLMVFNDPNYTNQSKRVKIRGHGKTLQYHVKSVTGEAFNIAGWSSFETGNTAP
jgi:hypothetical protein